MKTSKKSTHSQPIKDNPSPKTLSQYLQTYRIQKGNDQKITNTRIGSTELDIYGGKYGIPDDKYADFLQLYHHEVFTKSQPEYLTETQLEKGAILVDVDFRHDHSITARQYTSDHIADLVDEYLAVFKYAFQLEDGQTIRAFIFQKPSVNRLEDGSVTKDGIHIIFTLACDHTAQQLIRKKVLEKIADLWTTAELKLTNTWDKVFDEGISQGTTNWQLVGSRKPGNDAYRLTGIFEATFDSTDQEFATAFAEASTFNMKADIFQLSARYPHHEEPFMTTAFLSEYNQCKEGPKRMSAKPTASSSILAPLINPLNIRNHEDMEVALKQYIDSLSSERHKEYEAYRYTMILPEKYYGAGSYNHWFLVGCALRNISQSLFIVWLGFSAQSPTFSFIEDVDKLWDMWQKFEYKPDGLTFRSIYYWAKTDALEKWKEVRMTTLDYFIELSLDNGLTEFAVSDKKSQVADWEIALALHQMKKDQFVCSNIRANNWYQFMRHRWVAIDSGTTLRMAISTELRALYGKKAMDLQLACGDLEEEDPKVKYLTARRDKAVEIYGKLGRTADKRNIMEAARDLFYDDQFEQKVDTNPYLLCCTNGVWDFKEGRFRDGMPEDYISMTTRNEYVRDKPPAIVAEIHDFMAKLFPVAELREYMWDHLASTLVGTAVNQTFNNYLGAGRNGKSVLVTLMTKVLGEYKGELPLTAVVTAKRTAVGGLAPEIAALKGKRLVVMQEPRQGDVLNEGILKELTSGMDAIQARSMYSMPITFIPQFKLICCANVLPEIRSMDYGTWRRVRVVPFMSLFTENPVDDDPYKPYQFKLDPTIDEKFEVWKTVFLSILVDRVQKTDGRVPDCDTVLKASNEYKQKQDVFSQFIEEKIARSVGDRLKPRDVSLEFNAWHILNFGVKGPQAKDLHTYLDREFGPHDKQGWRDIRLVYENDTNGEIDPNDVMDPR